MGRQRHKSVLTVKFKAEGRGSSQLKDKIFGWFSTLGIKVESVPFCSRLSHNRCRFCRVRRSDVSLSFRKMGNRLGSNARAAPYAHEELLVQILHEELVGSAVHCRRARRASLLTASRDCSLPSGSEGTHVHASDESGAASERGGRVAARWRRESRAK
eukprot:6205552-Pleurochrysis_carterae.AAC.1